MTDSADDFSIAGFRLTQQLGSGRFGDSWLGESDQGAAVVKILHADPPDDGAEGRLLEEAARFAELRHRSIARLYTAGSLPDRRLYLVFEHGGEQSLADVLRAQARLSPPRALDVCAEIADGLHAGHLRGMLHRDLKAANVGLWHDAEGAELARVLDFPTIHLAARARLKESGPLPLSSAATLSPEEARGEKVDLRADLYALGVLLYQSLTGRLPVTGMTAAELLRSHRDHPALSLRDAGRKLPLLEEVIARLLRKHPGERPSTASEVAEELRALSPQVADEQHPRPPRAKSPPPETPLPADAPRLPAPPPAGDEDLDATTDSVGPIAGTEAIRAPSAAEIDAVTNDPEKTPPGGFAAPPGSPGESGDLPSDAPTPAEGMPLSTPLATAALQTPSGSARPVPPPPPPPRMETAPKKPASVHTAEFDPDSTPPDPVLAALEQLPPAPAWLEKQASEVAKFHGLEEQHLSARPAPPPPIAPPQPRTIPPQPAAVAAPAPVAIAPPAAAAVEEPEKTEPRGDATPSKAPILRRRRGSKVAFSGPGNRSGGMEGQLVKLGLGLIVLLGILVLIALKVMSSGEAPAKKRAPAAQGARSAPADSRVAEGSE